MPKHIEPKCVWQSPILFDISIGMAIDHEQNRKSIECFRVQAHTLDIPSPILNTITIKILNLSDCRPPYKYEL